MGDNPVTVTIDGAEYPMLFSMKAAKAALGRFGTMEEFNKRLYGRFTVEGGEEPEDENRETKGSGGRISFVYDAEFAELLTWLLALMINQPILKHNIKNPANEKELITEDFIDLHLTQGDIVPVYTKVIGAINKSMERHIIGQDKENGGEPKNAETA